MVAGINTTGVNPGAGGGQQILAALLRMAGGRRSNAPPQQPQQFDPGMGEALVAAGLAPPPVGAPSRPAGAAMGNLLAPGGIGGSVPQQPGGIGASVPQQPTPEEQALIARRQAMVAEGNNPFARGLLNQAQQAAMPPQRNLLAARQ